MEGAKTAFLILFQKGCNKKWTLEEVPKTLQNLSKTNKNQPQTNQNQSKPKEIQHLGSKTL